MEMDLMSKSYLSLSSLSAQVRTFFRHDIISAMQQTAQSMLSQKDKTVCSLLWQLAQARHILHFRLYGVYLKVV